MDSKQPNKPKVRKLPDLRYEVYLEYDGQNYTAMASTIKNAINKFYKLYKDIIPNLPLGGG